MRLNDPNNTIVSILIGVQLLQSTFGKFSSGYVQTLPREVPPPQSPLPDRLFHVPDRLFQLTSSPQYFGIHPRRKNLKSRKLRKRLGKAFDPEWMSIEQPDHLHEVVAGKLDIQLVSQAKHVNFSLSGTADADKNLNITSSMLQTAFQEWLVQRASCSINFSWNDLGINFWPRWIKRGFCVSEEPCSWPPGMHCLPSESRRIRLLRWQCITRYKRLKTKIDVKHGEDDPEMNATEDRSKLSRRERRKKQRYGMKCKWVKIRYPITDECFCSC